MADSQATGKRKRVSPRKRKRIIFQTQKKQQFLNSIQLPTSNKFSVLAGDDNAMETGEQQQQPARKKISISPIVVTDHTTNIQEILQPLKLDFNLQINSVGRKILTKSSEDKTKVIDELKKKNVIFYTHPEYDSKSFKVVLSGLPAFDCTVIEQSIKEQKIVPTKITMFNTKSEHKLYLLHFDASKVNKKTLETVKYVCHHKVKWLPYKPKRNSLTQCLRCLMYGHGIKSCNRYTVCMLCAGPHLTNTCTTHNTNDTNTNIEFKCFNCASAKLPHSHKANDVKCPFREKYDEARKNARTKTITKQSSQTNTSRTTAAPQPTPPHGQSYADSVRASTSSQNTHSQARSHTNTRSTNTSTRTNPNDNFNAAPGSNIWTFEECANILFSSIDKLQRCSTKLDQLKVIADLLSHACK